MNYLFDQELEMVNSKNNSATFEEIEKFEQFLFEMDDVLDEFLKMAEEAGYKLDFSLASLKTLEEFILNSPNHEGLSENRFARFLGEVFRKNVGGKWELCLKSPDYLFYKLPVISGYSKKSIEFCPIEIIENFKRKKEFGMLNDSIKSHLEFKAS